MSLPASAYRHSPEAGSFHKPRGNRRAASSEINPNEWLIQAVLFTNVELNFLASRADTTILRLLDVPKGEPVFTDERITRPQEQPVTFAKMIFAAGYRMTTRL